jgi:hypothetical protein
MVFVSVVLRMAKSYASKIKMLIANIKNIIIGLCGYVKRLKGWVKTPKFYP